MNIVYYKKTTNTKYCTLNHITLLLHTILHTYYYYTITQRQNIKNTHT